MQDSWRGTTVTRRSSRREGRTAHAVPIVVAAIGAVGVVLAALITASGGGSGGGSGDDDPGPGGTSTAQVSVTATALADAEPPPAVRLTVEGRASGLSGDQRVFVLGHFAATEASAATESAATASSPAEQYAVSPPAEHFPDGRWRVSWRLAERPADLTFTAVAADVIVVQGADAGPGVVPADPDSLRRQGPDASAVSPGEAFAVPREP